MKIRLKAMRGPLRGHTFEVNPGERCIVGRDPGAKISTVDSELSRQHCEIAWDGRSLRVRDLGSTNGTRVNGELSSEGILGDGDEIAVGRSVLRVEIPPGADATARPSAGEAPAGRWTTAGQDVPRPPRSEGVAELRDMRPGRRESGGDALAEPSAAPADPAHRPPRDDRTAPSGDTRPTPATASEARLAAPETASSHTAKGPQAGSSRMATGSQAGTLAPAESRSDAMSGSRVAGVTKTATTASTEAVVTGVTPVVAPAVAPPKVAAPAHPGVAAHHQRRDGDGPIEIFPNAEPTLPRTSQGAAPEGSLLGSLETALRASGSAYLYAVVDGARDVELAFTARLMEHRLFTLFEGDMAAHLAHLGPCLVALGRPGEENLAYLERWVEAIGKSAGVLLQTTADLRTLAQHLRSIFVVSDDEGQEYLFRFYDPRVLRVFLPTCHPEGISEFFGPIDRWLVESSDATGYVSYALTGKKRDAYTEVPIGARQEGIRDDPRP